MILWSCQEYVSKENETRREKRKGLIFFFHPSLEYFVFLLVLCRMTRGKSDELCRFIDERGERLKRDLYTEV